MSEYKVCNDLSAKLRITKKYCCSTLVLIKGGITLQKMIRNINFCLKMKMLIKKLFIACSFRVFDGPRFKLFEN